MTLIVTRNPDVQAYNHKEWVRVIAEDIKGQISWLYNGYAKPAFPYRKIETVVELQGAFDGARSLVSVVCMLGHKVDEVRLRETPEQILEYLKQQNLPLPKVIAFEI